MSTIIVLLGAILVVAAAAASLWLDKKNGKSSCGGSCAAGESTKQYDRKELRRPCIHGNRHASDPWQSFSSS